MDMILAFLPNHYKTQIVKSNCSVIDNFSKLGHFRCACTIYDNWQSMLCINEFNQQGCFVDLSKIRVILLYLTVF